MSGHPCRIPGWREPLASAIQLQVEDHCHLANRLLYVRYVLGLAM